MSAFKFDDYAILKFQGIDRYTLPEQKPEHPLPNAFIAGGFLFGHGRIVNDVPYDPELYFYGEEITMSARLWTHGYNIYCPNELLLFHLYKSSSNNGDRSTTHWSDHSDWFQLNRRSLVRIHTLLGSLQRAPEKLTPKTTDVETLPHYGLGTARTLEAYQAWAGVNFANQTISARALKGLFPAEQQSSNPLL